MVRYKTTVSTEQNSILIVEDSPVPLMELREKLNDVGYRILDTAASGEEAISKALALKPDLILMDIMLEGEMTGIQAAEFIRQNAAIEIPVIFITAYSDTETLEKVKETDPFGYLLKPVVDRELFMSIELALRRSQYQRRIEASENRYRRLFEDSRDAIFIIGDDGAFIDTNRSFLELFGYNESDSAIKHLKDLVRIPADLRAVRSEVYTHGFLKDYEITLMTRRGDILYCMVTANPLKDENGSFFGFQGIIRDITFQKRVQEDIERSMEEMRKIMNGIVRAMVMTLEAKDPYTAGHQRRVAALASEIAMRMELEPRRIEGIRMASLIHDLGKVYVPSEILSKPGKISTAELAIIRMHSRVGYEILRNIEFPWPLAECVLQHHERLDGSGYPAGISGEDILLEARILSVADVVEAMISHRPYRAALGMKNALDEIIDNRGRLYDPLTVDVCITILTDKNFLLEDMDTIDIFEAVR